MTAEDCSQCGVGISGICDIQNFPYTQCKYCEDNVCKSGKMATLALADATLARLPGGLPLPAGLRLLPGCLQSRARQGNNNTPSRLRLSRTTFTDTSVYCPL